MLELNGFKQNLLSLSENFSEKRFLLAVSGGVDSMVMASLFKELNCYFEIAHINYHFRGEDSNLDQQLVESFCQKHQIPFHLKDVTEKEKETMTSLQTWARDLRYNFFFDVLKNQNLDFIVTAHHLNDELETFIINLSRGSGIKGLSGIPHNKNHILRPLLNYSKEDIYEFAKLHNIPFREDKSNEKPDYLRNFIRHEITPKLSTVHESFLEQFLKTISHLQETQNFIEDIISKTLHEICDIHKEEIFVDKNKFNTLHSYLQYEFLKIYGFENKAEIEKIITAETRKTFVSKDYQLTVDRSFYIISNKNNTKETTSNNIILPHQQEFSIQEFLADFPLCDKIWYVNPDKISPPLQLRKKEDGDVFFPIESSYKKLISKFLKDMKLSISEKENVWVLCDSKQNVLGLIPYSQDRRSFSSETENSIKIMF